MVRGLDLGPVRAGRGHCVIREGEGEGVEILQLLLDHLSQIRIFSKAYSSHISII